MSPLPPAAGLPLYKVLDTADRTQKPPHLRELEPGLRPHLRPRRLRTTAAMRELVRETRVNPKQLILPVFALDDKARENREISSLPGVQQHTQDSLRDIAVQAARAGLGGLMIFGVPQPEDKDEFGSAAWDSAGVLNQALRVVKDEIGSELVVMADTCLDEFTSHGHCGLISAGGKIDNDATLACYQAMALSQAEAGADVVSPSGMMDGQVLAIRSALDAGRYAETAILAYSAKYASAFFSPFRQAVNSELQGDRYTYQQDPANRREGWRETLLDLEEGADMVMVKPAGYYLDVLSDVATASPVPVAAYQVSGEYAMVKAAAQNGWIDEAKVVQEQLTAIVRAGADLVLSYWALEYANF